MSPNKEGLKKTEVGLTSPYAAVGNPVFPYIRSVYGFGALPLTSDSRTLDSSDSRTLDSSDSRISDSPISDSPISHSPISHSRAVLWKPWSICGLFALTDLGLTGCFVDAVANLWFFGFALADFGLTDRVRRWRVRKWRRVRRLSQKPVNRANLRENRKVLKRGVLKRGVLKRGVLNQQKSQKPIN